ncbi:MAG: carboxypeptidase regulatory-like domain-containing protein, partial [Planctomycetota bacterium]
MRSENRCEDRRELIAALVMGELDSVSAEEVQKHIAGCDECRGLCDALCAEEREIRSAFEAISTAFKGTEEGILEKARSGGFENRASVKDEDRRGWIVRIIVPIAVAAIVVIAVVIGARLLIKGDDTEYVRDPIEDSGNVIPVVSGNEKLAGELRAVKQMFASKDSAGLISVLDTGLWESKVAAAKYLGQIGDERALPMLSNLLSSWEGSAAENPFSAAIEQIESRVQAPEPNEAGSKRTVPQKTVVAQQPAFKFEARGVLSGVVTDVQSGEPVVGAEVEVSMGRIYQAQTDANGFYCIEKIKKEGSYRISVSSHEYLGITDYDKMPMVDLRKDSREVKHFKLQRACMIEVKVVDEEGRPLEGADLIATSLADERSRDIGESRYSRRTDANGIMVLGGFPPSKTESYQITSRHYTKGRWVEKNGRKYQERLWDYAPSRAVVKLRDPNVLETCTIVMKKGIEVAGYAEYSDGVP